MGTCLKWCRSQIERSITTPKLAHNLSFSTPEKADGPQPDVVINTINGVIPIQVIHSSWVGFAKISHDDIIVISIDDVISIQITCPDLCSGWLPCITVCFYTRFAKSQIRSEIGTQLYSD